MLLCNTAVPLQAELYMHVHTGILHALLVFILYLPACCTITRFCTTLPPAFSFTRMNVADEKMILVKKYKYFIITAVQKADRRLPTRRQHFLPASYWQSSGQCWVRSTHDTVHITDGYWSIM